MLRTSKASPPPPPCTRPPDRTTPITANRLRLGQQQHKTPNQSSDLELVLYLHDAHGRAALLAVLRPVLLAEVDGVAFVDRAALACHRKICGRVPFNRLQPPEELNVFFVCRGWCSVSRKSTRMVMLLVVVVVWFVGVAIRSVDCAGAGAGGMCRYTQDSQFSGLFWPAQDAALYDRTNRIYSAMLL